MRRDVTEGMKPPKAMSGRELELFDDPKRREAAKDINAGIKKAAKGIVAWCAKQEKKGGFKPDGNDKHFTALAKEMGKQYVKHVKPPMKKWANLGAEDTEPRYHTAQALIDMVKRWYFDPGEYLPELGDYMETRKQVTFGLEESAGKGTLAFHMFPVLSKFGDLVGKGVKKGLAHKPTKWRSEFYSRIPAYFIEFETTDKSDFEVKGNINIIFDFAGGSVRGLTYRVEVKTNNAYTGQQQSEFQMTAHDQDSAVTKGILDRLRDQGNV